MIWCFRLKRTSLVVEVFGRSIRVVCWGVRDVMVCFFGKLSSLYDFTLPLFQGKKDPSTTLQKSLTWKKTLQNSGSLEACRRLKALMRRNKLSL